MLNVNSFMKESVCDGYGVRMVIFFQGCVHNCERCHNPSTHSFEKVREFTPKELFTYIKSLNPYLKAATLSGGDPLCQDLNSLFEFINLLKSEDYDIWLYTGYYFNELSNDMLEVVKKIDYLVDGPYDYHLPESTRMCGSKNQTIYDIKEMLEEGEFVD